MRDMFSKEVFIALHYIEQKVVLNQINNWYIPNILLL